MHLFDSQNPGIGGLDELTDSEVLVVQQIAGLGDPNADRILFWDDSASSYKFLTAGSGLTITGTTLDVTGGTATITTQDEGGTLSTSVNTLNFVGAGVTASGAGATTTITIPGGSGLTVGTTTITSGTTTRVLFDNAGVLGEYTISGTGNVAMTTSPSFTTPILGTPTSGNLANCTFPTLNQNTTGSAASLSVSGQTGLITMTGILSTNRVKTVRDAADTILELGGSYTPTGTWTSMTLVTPALGTPASGVVTNLTGTASININGTVGATTPNTGSFTTITTSGNIELGNASDTTLARVSAGVASIEGATIGTLSTAQTWTATQTEKLVLYTQNAITASANAATVPVTHRFHTVTNNSAATLTITMTIASAVNGQLCMVEVLDFSAAAQTITWVNTENSTVTAPTTSNGSTTLPLTVGFKYNSATSKWRCIASA